MDADEAYEAGLERLAELWLAAEDEPAGGLPAEVVSAMSTVLAPDAQVSQRYALITQLLLKDVLSLPDARQLKDFPSVESISARSFAKKVVSSFGPLTRRLGGSADPYVSNPLRRPRLEDALAQGRSGAGWSALFLVLAHADANPQQTGLMLAQALRRVQQWPEVEPPTRLPTETVVVGARDLPGLVAATGLDEDLLLDIVDVLESDQPQVILAGPPGTSKTHTAMALARYLTGDDDRVTVAQFHATYGYEDFVEGLRPQGGKDGLAFHVVPGIVRRVSDRARDGLRHVLVLDELNRANLPRVLGEMLFAIERRNQPLDLLYTPGFRLPPNIAFIGTMNTADRSIRSIDAAVRRRFQLFELPPTAAVLAGFYGGDRPNEVGDLVEGFTALNAELSQLLDRHHTVGHTFFMDGRGMTAGRLRQVWLRQVLPLLEEYFFEQPEELARFTLERFWPSTSA